jgi:hypothetical protein
MNWPYHRPIMIWCKDRPHWCDMGPERDPVRLLMRAAAHLDMASADLIVLEEFRGENSTDQTANALACNTMMRCALGIRREHGQAHSRSLHPANA